MHSSQRKHDAEAVAGVPAVFEVAFGVAFVVAVPVMVRSCSSSGSGQTGEQKYVR